MDHARSNDRLLRACTPSLHLPRCVSAYNCTLINIITPMLHERYNNFFSRLHMLWPKHRSIRCGVICLWQGASSTN